MKNTMKIVWMSAITILLAMQTQAQNKPAPATDKETNTSVTAPGTFTDQNKNGICDHFEARQNKGGQGRNFVDKDGDGICDHRKNGNPNGQGYCRGGQFRGQGKGFGNGQGCGQGCGRGHGPRWHGKIDNTPKEDAK